MPEMATAPAVPIDVAAASIRDQVSDFTGASAATRKATTPTASKVGSKSNDVKPTSEVFQYLDDGDTMQSMPFVVAM